MKLQWPASALGLGLVLCAVGGCPAPSADAVDAGAVDTDARDAGGESGPDGGSADGGESTPPPDGGTGETQDVDRVIVAGLVGGMASVEIDAPFAVAASTTLDRPVHQIRCGVDICVALHGAPTAALTFVDARTLEVRQVVELPSRPHDAVFVDDAVYVSHAGASLWVFHSSTFAALPERHLATLGNGARYMSACGRTLWIQVERGVGGALVGYSLDDEGVVEIALDIAPDLELSPVCAEERIFVATPQPLFEGGGAFWEVDLLALTATQLPSFGGGGEVGGLVLTGTSRGFYIEHTEFGPAPSTHLARVAQGEHLALNATFALQHIDDLHVEVDVSVFFPDGCTTDIYDTCETGLHVLDAASGESLTGPPLDLGFAPFFVERSAKIQ